MRYFKSLLFIFTILIAQLTCSPCIVIVHIGPTIPTYTKDCIEQVRLFNKECPIYLLGNKKALNKFTAKNFNILKIPLESLPKSDAHKYFEDNSTHRVDYRQGFWRYATERFLYLEEFARVNKLKHIYHIESDNMLYCDLNEIHGVVEEFYPEAGIEFDHDERAIPGLIYFNNFQVITELADVITGYANEGLDDMRTVAIWSLESPLHQTHFLPVLPFSITQKYNTLTNNCKTGYAKKPLDYSSNLEEFNSIFDPAPIGQWLFGQDPRNGKGVTPYRNPYSVIHPEKLKLTWIKDSSNRSVLFVQDGDQLRKLNNLHIHSKNLKKASSKRQARFLNSFIPKVSRIH